MQGKGLSIALKALAIFAVTLLVTSSWAGTNWSAKALHIFGGADGAHPPSGLIIDAAGNLYGTTYHGGTYGVGTVFELSPTQGGGWTEAVLHSFNNNGVDGYYPNGGLIFDAAGNLYGTTYSGPDYGSVFKMSPNEGGGWTETVLYTFPGFGGGRYPQGSLIFDAAGNLYGTTTQGGIYSGGTVFELSPTQGGGWTEKVLHNFGDGNDGGGPFAGLIFDAAGNLYGTTVGGGTWAGTVFELTPSESGSWTETVLYNFGRLPDGEGPWAGVTFDAAGNLYGTTRMGGTSNSCYGGCGTLFEISPNGNGSWAETFVHSFGYGKDGASPYYAGVVFDAAGNLYGTTQEGGDLSGGIVFEFSPNGSGGWTETVLHSFDNVANGYWPFAGVTFDEAGNLYGTTYENGTNGDGAVFELTPVHPCTKCSHAGLR